MCHCALQFGVIGLLLGARFAHSAVATNVWNVSMLKSFGSNAFSEALLSAPLIEGSDGYLYGTAQTGGSGGYGVVFRMSKEGNDYKVLHSFAANDGAAPRAGLIEATAGQLFGTASFGGTNALGVIFRMNSDGSAFVVLHHFNGADGEAPASNLIRASDGLLYGTASKGGANRLGTIFRINPNGTGFQVLFQFGTSANDPHTPLAGLIESSDGVLYGTGSAGALEGLGAVFKIKASGNGYSILHTFSATDGDGQSPATSLVDGNDGFLYGTTPAGGLWSLGCVFKVPKTGLGYSIIHDFGASDAQAPLAGLILARDGFLYGTAFAGAGRFSGGVFKISKDGLSYTLLRSFGGSADGRNPAASLLQGSDGDLYGTTSSGGSLSGNATDGGTVFKLNTAGIDYAILRSFSRTGGDGQSPGGLISATDGFLYGTTSSGGAFGNGSIFRLVPDGLGYELLYSFKATNPLAEAEQLLPSKLLQGTDGALYGTTHFGGAAGAGVLFKINVDGTAFSVLRNFTHSASDGRNPVGALVEGSDGMLHGVTQFGGLSDAGTIFEISKDGSGFALLRSFSRAGTDAYYPYGELVRASNGKLYGTTFSGGTAGGGVLFEINQDGTGYNVLHNFESGAGSSPATLVTEAQDGLLYGTTQRGGIYGGATAFRIAKDGTGYKVLWNFVASEGMPSEIIQGTDGRLYGTTGNGGTAGAGSIFKLSTDGSEFQRVYSFGSAPGLGANPQAGLIRNAAGQMFGATGTGGHLGLGIVFRLTSEAGIPLRISRSPAGLELAWPASAAGYRLESADSSTVASWQNVDAVPMVFGMENSVTIEPAANQRFYRLTR